MKPLKLINKTRVLEQSQEGLLPLEIEDVELSGVNLMNSCWSLSENEIEMLKNGGAIKLSIVGTIHPPVLLMVVDENGN